MYPSGRSGAEFANFSYLEMIKISYKPEQIKWEIELVPELFELSHLRTIELNGVNIVTPLPATFSTSSLTSASIINCEMPGMLPETLSVNLTDVDFGYNRLEGGIPLSW